MWCCFLCAPEVDVRGLSRVYKSALCPSAPLLFLSTFHPSSHTPFSPLPLPPLSICPAFPTRATPIMDRVGSGAIVEIVAEFLIATATTIWRTSLGLRSAKGLLFDDILAIIATCLWWVGSAIFAFTGSHYRLSNANLTESQRLDIHHGSLQDTAHDAMMGSIMFFIGWEVTIIFIWTLKLSVLYNFASLMGKVPGMTRPLQCATVFWAASLSGVVLYHHLKCLPVQKNWQIFPDPGSKSSDSTRDDETLKLTCPRRMPASFGDPEPISLEPVRRHHGHRVHHHRA